MAEDDSKLLLRVTKRIAQHRLGDFVVDFAKCNLRKHDHQRDLVPEQVDKLHDDFLKKLHRKTPLVAIFYGDPNSLPKEGAELAGITLSLISGQHRIAALLKLSGEYEKWWPVTLFHAGTYVCPTAFLTLTFFSLFSRYRKR
jgi:hypothetical protein